MQLIFFDTEKRLVALSEKIRCVTGCRSPVSSGGEATSRAAGRWWPTRRCMTAASSIGFWTRATPRKTHSPDQRSQLLTDRRPASQRARLPAPVAAKPGTVPPHQRLGPDNQHCLEDRREPAIELDEEQAVGVTEPDSTAHLALQHNQLLPERGIFGFKSALGLDDCRQQVEGQEDQRDHPRKRDVIPSPVQCGRGIRYTHPFRDMRLRTGTRQQCVLRPGFETSGWACSGSQL
jgi:hypothetical protein